MNELYENLRRNCKECFGLCCRALYFSKCDGFPEDKLPGKSCKNLEKDFKWRKFKWSISYWLRLKKLRFKWM